ncbi:MAG TPA: ankyrin repeat domain-containing protein, partial [Pirellulaceae bacterium]|nr:ankyrin repeat domain-containing protein [Pirellulaceae bacterium]
SIETHQRLKKSTKEVVEYCGFRMNPCQVRTSQGQMRILGFPQLDAVTQRRTRDVYSARAALAYLRDTTFEDISGLKLIHGLTAFKEVWDDDDGELCRELRQRSENQAKPLFSPELEEFLDQLTTPRPKYEMLEKDDDEEGDDDAEPSELDGYRSEIPLFIERRVHNGEAVCVIGRFDAEKNGLVPRGSGRLNRLLPGDADTIDRRLHSSAVLSFWGGLFVLVLTHGIIYGGTYLYANSPEVRRARTEEVTKAIEANDLPALTKLIERGIKLPPLEHDKSLIMQASEPAVVAFLIEHGADVNKTGDYAMTPLMDAARNGRVEIVKLLIAAGADLNARNPNYNSTALVMADRIDQVEIATLLRQAGAEDDVVTAQNGRALPEDGGAPLAAVTAYLTAIHAANAEQVRGMTSQQSPATFQDVDWALWHSCRPLQAERFSGFMTDNRATLSLTGITGGGYQSTWHYQVVNEGGAWKVLREDD